MTILVVDLNNIAHRAFHAFSKNPLRTSYGKETSMCYGVASILSKVTREMSFSHIVAAADSPGLTARHSIYPEYKGTRPSLDPAFFQQFQDLIEMMDCLDIKVVARAGAEADDIMATIALKYPGPVYLLSNDKDLCQLVDDRVKLLVPQRGGGVVVGDVDYVVEKFGVAPDRFVQYLALCGDASDNIPGVPGIGPVMARRIIRGEAVGPKVIEKMAKGAASYEMSAKLAQSDGNLPIDLNFDLMRLSPNFMSSDKAADFFRKMEFAGFMGLF